MKISAVIPAYNASAFIGAALDSVMNQSLPLDEIIVVDDGSTDNTEDIVREHPSGAHYVAQSNQGPSAARNRGVQLARSDWIAFLDADDQWTERKTEEQIAALRKHPQLKLIASDMAEIDPEGRTIANSVQEKHQQKNQFRELDGAPIPHALAALVRKNFIPTGTVLAEKAVLLQAGLFNPSIRFGEDLELWSKLARDYPITCLAQVHMLRRQHGANATSCTAPMLADLVKVMQSIKNTSEPELAKQGVDSSELVANARWDLAYWHFQHGDYSRARQGFRQSHLERPNRRALIYATVCGLPAPIISGLRRTKQIASGSNR